MWPQLKERGKDGQTYSHPFDPDLTSSHVGLLILIPQDDLSVDLAVALGVVPLSKSDFAVGARGA